MGSNAEYAMGKLMAKNKEANARIVELTTEVADLKSKIVFLEAMESEQGKTVAELTAEVARYKAALSDIAVGPGDSTWVRAFKIARNALKEG